MVMYNSECQPEIQLKIQLSSTVNFILIKDLQCFHKDKSELSRTWVESMLVHCHLQGSNVGIF